MDTTHIDVTECRRFDKDRGTTTYTIEILMPHPHGKGGPEFGRLGATTQRTRLEQESAVGLPKPREILLRMVEDRVSNDIYSRLMEAAKRGYPPFSEYLVGVRLTSAGDPLRLSTTFTAEACVGGYATRASLRITQFDAVTMPRGVELIEHVSDNLSRQMAAQFITIVKENLAP